MKREGKEYLEQSTIPNDLCPVATEPLDIKTGDWRAERPVVDRERCVKCATCWL
ncbi:MAG: ferredoxin oxidoreductase, partial [Deltaproteobacteria bacterium]|nr:ferredoxin oxidoreductase [Deltaproteobacteria bacterium]